MAYEEFLGKSETVEDVVTASWLESAAAIVGAPEPADACLQPLWHWMLFQRWPARLRPDGGVLGEGFLPPFGHLPRRMHAGGRLTFYRPVRVGDEVRRTSRIQAISDKQGRNGPLVFLTIARELWASGELAIAEEQQNVYLAEAPVSVQAPRAVQPVPSDARSVRFAADPLTLFRYSAFTANSHRIHYDLAYATGVEGFPGLVVHGPLMATWLAQVAAAAGGGTPLRSIEFRNLGPAFHTDTLVASSWPGDGALQLDLRRESGEPCMSARAVFAH